MAKNYDDEDEIDDGFVDDYVEDEDDGINIDKETDNIEDEAPDIDWDQGAMDEPTPDIPEDYSEFPDPMPFNEDGDYDEDDEDDEESFKDPNDTGFEEMLVEKKKTSAKRPAPKQETPVQKPAPRKPHIQPTRPHPQPQPAVVPAKPVQTQNIAGNYARIEGDIVLNCNLACNASLEIVGCTIIGDLSAKELHINGTVKGNVVGASVNIGKDAVIEGNIKAKSIHIEKGAQIIGDMSMG